MDLVPSIQKTQRVYSVLSDIIWLVTFSNKSVNVATAKTLETLQNWQM